MEFQCVLGHGWAGLLGGQALADVPISEKHYSVNPENRTFPHFSGTFSLSLLDDQSLGHLAPHFGDSRNLKIKINQPFIYSFILWYEQP